MFHIMKMVKDIFKKQKRGFTVVEAMVAISILLLSITGAFTVAQSSLQSTSYAKNKTAAYYLAQEGLEYIRHLRDNNGLKMLKDRTGTVTWLDGFAKPGAGNPCSDSAPCYVDSTNEIGSEPIVCPESGCPLFYLNVATGQFQYVDKHDLTVPSTFRRTITIIPQSIDASTDDQVRVRVVVDWDQNGVPRSLEVSENLYNWQKL